MSFNPNVSKLWIYPFAIFAIIAAVPWWETKSGDLLPLAMCYCDLREGWQQILLWHLTATASLSLLFVGLHLRLRQLLNHPTQTQTLTS